MNINTLPDLCLLKILNNLSINELFNLKVVCHRWYAIIPSVFKRKTSLAVFGRNQLDYYSNVNSLRCDRLNFFGINNAKFDLQLGFCLLSFTQLNERLLETFPNIKQLTLVHYNITEVNETNLASFLKNWPSLRVLHFVGLRNGSHNWNRFAKRLNELKCLEVLSIDVNISRIRDLTIFRQLRQLDCRFVLADRVEVNLYQRSVPNQLVGKHLERVGFYVDDNGLINCLSTSEAAKLDRLAIIIGFLSQLKLISTKFTAITYLDLTFYDNESNIECFLASLKQLKHLQELRLFLSPLHNYFMKITEQNIASLPKLETIKKVELQFPIDPHKFAWIEAIFPNAEAVTISIGQFLYNDFIQLLCKGCANCTQIELAIEKTKTCPEASLKFSFKNEIIIEFL